MNVLNWTFLEYASITCKLMKLDKLELSLALVLPFAYFQCHYYYYEGLFLCQICLLCKNWHFLIDTLYRWWLWQHMKECPRNFMGQNWLDPEGSYLSSNSLMHKRIVWLKVCQTFSFLSITFPYLSIYLFLFLSIFSQLPLPLVSEGAPFPCTQS